MTPGKIKIQISKNLQRKLQKGYPWVYYYQLKNINVEGKVGDLGVVYDSNNRFLAIGLYDPFSDIRLRILQSNKPTEINRAFFQERLKKALILRDELEGNGTTGYRILNGENDGFPGLVLDRYENILALKIYTAAWIPYLDQLTEIIQQEIKELEGLVLLFSGHVERTQTSSYYNGQILFGSLIEGPVIFKENGLLFEADIIHGQKTGFFLDQRENRRQIKDRSVGCNVLNVFSYSGGFSVYAFAGKCESVTEIEINKHALEASRANINLNFGNQLLNSERFQQIQGDAFKVLHELKRVDQKYDLVVLDPPAFAKSKKNKKNAIQAYIRLVKFGASCTQAGGVLFAASCSSLITPKEFYRAVDLGIRQTGRTFEKILKTQHPIDHPVIFKEGGYLKAIYCKITS